MTTGITQPSQRLASGPHECSISKGRVPERHPHPPSISPWHRFDIVAMERNQSSGHHRPMMTLRFHIEFGGEGRSGVGAHIRRSPNLQWFVK